MPGEDPHSQVDDVNDANTDETRRRAQENLDHLKALEGALQTSH